ncbi:MAG: hypothetical protein H0V51_13730 [Chloroflexi bacterium]|nr:hypothetical protein [Chloroflexota bacterium]
MQCRTQCAPPRSLTNPIVLFFFEVALFLLLMLTVALAELASLGAALGLWLVCTVASNAGYLLARGRLARGGWRTAPTSMSSLDARWARTLLHYWRGTNLLLLAGALVGGIWYWLTRIS